MMNCQLSGFTENKCTPFVLRFVIARPRRSKIDLTRVVAHMRALVLGM